MADITQILQYVFGDEGGWTAGKDDRGGETYRGISRVNWPNWSGWPIIDGVPSGLKVEGAIFKIPALDAAVVAFYQSYLPDLTPISDQEVANKCGDLIVNMLHNGISVIQQALQRVQTGPVVVDGKWGPHTAEGVEAEAENYKERFLQALRYFQVQHYYANDQGPELNGLIWRACR